tara:strand:- start:2299 stop:3294 length:996 start_codon:yes stop_codon:yes gene_type:complete
VNKKYIIKNYTDLCSPILGSKILSCSDEFFAPARRLLNPSDPVFKDNVFDDHGKWMDGWETRRKRVKGHDYVLIKLGKPGKIKTVNIDTSYFNGNQPEYAQVEGCYSHNTSVSKTKWIKLTKKNKIKPNSNNFFNSLSSKTFSHIRLNIYPDGGVARLRLFGNIDLSLQIIKKKTTIDLTSILNGSQIRACSDEHFGNVNNILLPGKSINMGNGWETRRRRGKGFDWAIIKLGHISFIESFEVCTHHFKGNFPESFSIQALYNLNNININSLLKKNQKWVTLVSKSKLRANTTLTIKNKQSLIQRFNYIKLNIFPDGGISRFRVFGKIATK